VVLLGHSNGGQGVWYLAERYPDRVIAGLHFMSSPKSRVDCLLGAVPAAAYTKSQLYVSLQHSHGSHFIDQSLKSVLESALMPDDNDLFATNLAGMPLMAIHGYVFPPHHSCS
jgi:pimeloyl-ACP methyl ester carboxylesterase